MEVFKCLKILILFLISICKTDSIRWISIHECGLDGSILCQEEKYLCKKLIPGSYSELKRLSFTVKWLHEIDSKFASVATLGFS